MIWAGVCTDDRIPVKAQCTGVENTVRSPQRRKSFSVFLWVNAIAINTLLLEDL
jgi:hypothetical protein